MRSRFSPRRVTTGLKPSDSADLHRVLGLDGLEVMAARWLEHSFTPHMHDFYAISLNEAGRGAFECRGESRDAAPGTCNLIAPGDLHTGRATSGDGWTYRNLHIEASLMTDLLRGLEWPSPSEIRFKAPLVRDTVLASRLERLFAGLEQGEALLQSESSMLSVVARLLTDHVAPGDALREPGREHAAIRRVKEWLEANPEQNVSVHALAAEAGLSPYYLVRAFHKHVGMPPHRYQTVVRVLRARKFLRTGMPIAEAAYQAGFYDQSHLTRSFKCTLGTTPGRYSRAHTPLT